MIDLFDYFSAKNKTYLGVKKHKWIKKRLIKSATITFKLKGLVNTKAIQKLRNGQRSQGVVDFVAYRSIYFRGGVIDKTKM